MTNVNEAPTDINLSSSTIAENQAAGTVVGTLSSSDPDTGNAFTYTLVAGTGSTDNASFAIVNGQVVTAASFDFDTKSTYSIRVQTADQGGLSFAKVFTISVTDANDAPTDLNLSPTTVAENSAIGTTVGSFNTTDPDSANTFTYTLVTGAGANDNSLFTIQGANLKTNAILDFEARSVYSIRVKTTDQGGLNFEKQFTITVTDANDAPTDLALAGSSIPEDAAIGTIVGTFSSTDVDSTNTFSYSFVGGTGSNNNSAFQIVDGKLVTAIGFNFETKSSYTIRVRSTDQGNLSFEKALTIGVTNVNEAPTDIALSPGSIPEGLPIGSGAGLLTTSDPDAGDTFTYTLVTGTGSGDNSSFNIVNNQLRTTAVFDLETKNSYSIRIRSTDVAGLSVEKQLTVTVTNTNDPPTGIDLTSSTILESLPSGTVIGSFNATDSDAGNTFTYALAVGEGQWPTAQQSSLRLRTEEQLYDPCAY